MLICLMIPLLSFIEAADLSSITKAISKGDVNELSQFFDNSVEIAVLDQEDVYDKAGATRVVKNFFEKYKPTSFSQVHQGTSKDSMYCIGNMNAGGTTFRVYIYLKDKGGKFFIQELRFDKE